MPKTICVGLFFITVLCTGASGTVSDTLARIDQYVFSEMSRQRIPGMALAAVKHGETVVAKGYGFANLDAHVPATRHSIFQAGSIGKQFTAAAILLLEEPKQAHQCRKAVPSAIGKHPARPSADDVLGGPGDQVAQEK